MFVSGGRDQRPVRSWAPRPVLVNFPFHTNQQNPQWFKHQLDSYGRSNLRVNLISHSKSNLQIFGLIPSSNGCPLSIVQSPRSCPPRLRHDILSRYSQTRIVAEYSLQSELGLGGDETTRGLRQYISVQVVLNPWQVGLFNCP